MQILKRKKKINKYIKTFFLIFSKEIKELIQIQFDQYYPWLVTSRFNGIESSSCINWSIALVNNYFYIYSIVILTQAFDYDKEKKKKLPIFKRKTIYILLNFKIAISLR